MPDLTKVLHKFCGSIPPTGSQMVVSDQSDNSEQGLTWGTKTEAQSSLDHYLQRKFSLKCPEVR